MNSSTLENNKAYKNRVEAVLMASDEPVSLEKLAAIFAVDGLSVKEIKEHITLLQQEYSDRGLELKCLSSGYVFQTKKEYAPWVVRLWEEKPPKYSRALLETLVIIAYRQPITRPEIEAIRGVTVSSQIIKTLLEREWIKVKGHRDVPGRPAMYVTTSYFLDYFNLNSLQDLPEFVNTT